MVEKNMGHVIEVDGMAIEVWLNEGHVFLFYGDSQMGDFPFGMPGKYEIQQLAQRVANGEAKVLACMSPYAVIDENDDVTIGGSRIYLGGHTVH